MTIKHTKCAHSGLHQKFTRLYLFSFITAVCRCFSHVSQCFSVGPSISYSDTLCTVDYYNVISLSDTNVYKKNIFYVVISSIILPSKYIKCIYYIFTHYVDCSCTFKGKKSLHFTTWVWKSIKMRLIHVHCRTGNRTAIKIVVNTSLSVTIWRSVLSLGFKFDI